MIVAKFKICGDKPNIVKIMSKYDSVDYGYKEVEKFVILSIKNVMSIVTLNQIKRALGSKRNRSSQVELIEFKKG